MRLPSLPRPGQLRSEAIRFLMSGAMVTIVGTVAIAPLLHILPYALAYTVVFVLSTAANIQLHSRFVFRRNLGAALAIKAVAIQLIQYCIGLAGLALFFDLLGLGPTLSPVANLFLCTPINFLLSRYVFHSGETT